MEKGLADDRKIYLTFDTDWACDEVFDETINVVESEDIAATFFVTHETKLLERLRANPKVELGIHPNFNRLEGGSITERIEEVITSFMKIVPEAVSARSHSLFQSSQILAALSRFGITHDVNLLIPGYSGIILQPFIHPVKIIRVPFLWEDDVYFDKNAKDFKADWTAFKLLRRPGLKVFNFHPIHVYLNTENLQRYDLARKVNFQMGQLEDIRNRSGVEGTKVFLKELIQKAKLKKISFDLIKNIKTS